MNSRLDFACFGPRHESWQDIARERDSEAYRGKYGEPVGSIIHLPPYAMYRAGDRVKVNDRMARVMRAEPELGIIEVIYDHE